MTKFLFYKVSHFTRPLNRFQNWTSSTKFVVYPSIIIKSENLHSRWHNLQNKQAVVAKGYFWCQKPYPDGHFFQFAWLFFRKKSQNTPLEIFLATPLWPDNEYLKKVTMQLTRQLPGLVIINLVWKMTICFTNLWFELISTELVLQFAYSKTHDYSTSKPT